MSSDSKFFLGVVIAAILVIGGVVLFSGKSKTDTQTAEVDTSVGYKLGPDDAKVKVVEFGDFQCPACQVAASEFRKVQKDNSDVQLIFRHFPLTNVHKNAESSSLAAEAAAKQGKFWEMYDLLYERQSSWQATTSPEEVFSGYAQELGLSVDQFIKDMKSDDAKNLVKRDQDYGLSLNVDQTPTFYVNGQKRSGVQTAENWQELLNTARGQ